MARYTLASLREADEELADLIDSFLFESPTVRRDAHLTNRCGPIAFGGLIHVTGQPSGYPPGTGHYLATSGRWVLDWSYRQFEPTAPLPVIYERADLDPQVTAFGVGGVGRAWHPWQHMSGELEWDDPLYPDFVEYAANTDPLAYLAPGTDDPEWVTPYDER